MLQHLGVFASDFDASREFYRAALGVLGIEVGYETESIAEFWRAGTDAPSLSLERAAGEPTHGLHLAFAAPDRAHVDRFFRVATRLPARRLVDPEPWLMEAGLALAERRTSEWGLLRAERWVRTTSR